MSTLKGCASWSSIQGNSATTLQGWFSLAWLPRVARPRNPYMLSEYEICSLSCLTLPLFQVVVPCLPFRCGERSESAERQAKSRVSPGHFQAQRSPDLPYFVTAVPLPFCFLGE
jgi:hypothetical protein